MAGDFQAARMGGHDRSAQFRARDVHVGLERRCAQPGPVFDKRLRVLRSAQFQHLRGEAAGAFQIASRDVHVGTRVAARIDPFFDHQIGLNFEASAGSGCRDAAREIKPGEAQSVFNINGRAAARWVEEMLVHADEARDHRVIRQILKAEVVWNGELIRIAYGLNQTIAKEDRLICAGRRAGTVNHAHMHQCDGAIDADERLRGRQARKRGHRDDEAHGFIGPQSFTGPAIRLNCFPGRFARLRASGSRWQWRVSGNSSDRGPPDSA